MKLFILILLFLVLVLMPLTMLTGCAVTYDRLPDGTVSFSGEVKPEVVGAAVGAMTLMR